VITDILGNDVDFENNLDPSSVAIVVEPEFGVVEVSADGSVAYQPLGWVVGVDAFSYMVADEEGAVSEPAVVTVRVGEEVNVVTGSDRNDRIIGDEDDEIIFAFAKNDHAEGRGGNDIIFGGRGNDRMFGGGDDDILIGGPGNDNMDGGDGRDVAVFAGEFADFRIKGGGAKLQVQDETKAEGNNTLSAIEVLQFDDGFFDVAEDSFDDGYASATLEALLTSPKFTNDPTPAFAEGLSNQVASLINDTEAV